MRKKVGVAKRMKERWNEEGREGRGKGTGLEKADEEEQE